MGFFSDKQTLSLVSQNIYMQLGLHSENYINFDLNTRSYFERIVSLLVQHRNSLNMTEVSQEIKLAGPLNVSANAVNLLRTIENMVLQLEAASGKTEEEVQEAILLFKQSAEAQSFAEEQLNRALDKFQYDVTDAAAVEKDEDDVDETSLSDEEIQELLVEEETAGEEKPKSKRGRRKKVVEGDPGIQDVVVYYGGDVIRVRELVESHKALRLKLEALEKQVADFYNPELIQAINTELQEANKHVQQ